MFESFFMSFAVGLLISAPMGAVGVMCLRQCIFRGPLMGVMSGFSCALADGLYAAIAAFGFANIASYLVAHITAIQIFGIIFLSINGILLLRLSPPHADLSHANNKKKKSRINQLVNIFLATAINPATVIAIPGALAAIGLLDHKIDYQEASSIVAGVISGTTFWWVMVAIFVARYREKVTQQHILIINKMTGGILIACSVAIAVNLLRHL